MSTELVRPQIEYAAALLGPGTVLVEYTAVAGAGSWQREVLDISVKLGEEGVEWKSYCSMQHAFHFTLDVCLNVRFVCIADKTMGRRLPFAFLEAFEHRFNQRFMPQQVADAMPGGLQAIFADEVRALVEKYSSPKLDRASLLTAKVQAINENLMDTIDKLVDRQGKIDDLVGRSNLLTESASSFQRDARVVQSKFSQYRWQRRSIVVVGSLLSAAALVITIMESCSHFKNFL